MDIMAAGDMCDVLVVGGGISGLRAADLLSEQGCSVTVLEAKDRVGGRTNSIQVSHGDRERMIDLGGQWVAPSQRRVIRLLDDFDIKLIKQNETGKKIMDSGQGAPKTYSGLIPPLGIKSLLQLQFKTAAQYAVCTAANGLLNHGLLMQLINKLNSMAKTIPVDDPAQCPNAREWDSMTMETWAAKHTSGAARQATRAAVAMVMGCEPGQISVLYFCWYIAAAGSIEQLTETGEAAQDKFVSGGAQQISERLAARFTSRSPANQLHLSMPVRTVKSTADSQWVEATTMSGATFRARRLVLAIPPAQTGRIVFEPEIPPERNFLGQRASMGCYAKCVVLYRTAFWRSKGLCGEALRLAPTPALPVVSVYDASYENGELAAVAAFVPGNDALGFASQPQDTRRKMVLDCLERCFGPEARECIGYYDKCWTEEPFTGGCPVNTYQLGAFSLVGTSLRRAHGLLHFAGTETATIWSGYMEGALQAAERVAQEVAEALRTP